MNEWWRNAVIYEIYPRSFADSTGNGVGDISGMTRNLPYLAELGVDAVWVTPWYRSPMADGGYDIADYLDIDPELGTLADAQHFIDTAHHLGIRVLIDLVPNHTSVEHPWFTSACAAAPDSPERAHYWFRPGRGDTAQETPNDWRSVFGGSAWSPSGMDDGEWYLHLFAPEQPDLCWQNPNVRSYFDDVLRFWFKRGVDGFRIDVAHGLTKDPDLPDAVSDGVALDPLEGSGAAVSPGHPYWDRDESQEIFRRWRRIADEYSPPGRERVFVAEAWRIRSGGLRRYVGEERLHSAFNFDFLAACWDADDIRARVDDHLIQMASAGAAPTWVLGSHDITRVATRLAADESWGQRRLSATPPEPDLTLGRRRATALAMFTFALPGAVYIYQGDELGLPEVEDLPDSALQDPIWERSGRQVRGRDGCRVPIPWTSDYPKLGFTTGTPWLPVPTDWSSLSVEEQDADHASTLATYRQALRIRRRLFEPQASDGAVVWRSTPPGVLAFDRGGARCILNTTKQAVALPPSMAVVLSSAPDAGPEQVPADACLWLEVTA